MSFDQTELLNRAHCHWRGDHLVDIGVADDRQNRPNCSSSTSGLPLPRSAMSVTGKNAPVPALFTKHRRPPPFLAARSIARPIELHAVLDRTQNAVLVQAVADRMVWQRQ
jgi:hypothetical protein